ncbi:MAG: hypothetical protein N3F63_06780 [Thermoplasmata archaeon]|nr:hypothetical protein [Thermoplasmata archaeon]
MECSAKPWFFVNQEMIKYAKMLSPQKLSDMRVARAVYQLVSGRFQIKLSSLKPWAFYKIQPSCEIWNLEVQPPMKVSFVLISMLYLTERFDDIKLYSTTQKYGIFTRPHYYVRLKIGEKRYDLDPLAYHAGREFGERFGKEGTEAGIPSIKYSCNQHLKIGEHTLHLCGLTP